jgi:hypothetical protein
VRDGVCIAREVVPVSQWRVLADLYCLRCGAMQPLLEQAGWCPSLYFPSFPTARWSVQQQRASMASSFNEHTPRAIQTTITTQSPRLIDQPQLSRASIRHCPHPSHHDSKAQPSQPLPSTSSLSLSHNKLAANRALYSGATCRLQNTARLHLRQAH